jgi:AraC family transcriptional regulator of adaptative response / DNA-3-methyladenine glycosylase II
LISLGVGPLKADAVRALARGARNGQLRFEKAMDANALLARLLQIPGITDGTAQWVTMRSLREPDVFASADRDLARVLNLGSSRELEQRSEVWRPWRAYAAIYLRMFGSEIRARRNSSTPSANKHLPTGKTDIGSRITIVERQAS